ncbi:MAG: hypothetical protein IEMM0008_0085 [bacterium]|nr:MAG: hypothetical protein IEMM0008_0085 [bacterium]
MTLRLLNTYKTLSRWRFLYFFALSMMILIATPKGLGAKISKKTTISIYPMDHCKKLKLMVRLYKTDCLRLNGFYISVTKDEFSSLLENPKKYLARPGISKKKSPPLGRFIKMKISLVQVKEGDVCIVSGQYIGPDDVVIEHENNRFPLKKEALTTFLENPGKYISKKQPKGALFSNEIVKSRPLSKIWLILAIYIFVGLVFAALTVQKALAKKYRPAPWFFMGLFFNVIAYIIILSKDEASRSEQENVSSELFRSTQPVLCPECGMENHPSAQSCTECQSPLVTLSNSN